MGERTNSSKHVPKATFCAKIINVFNLEVKVSNIGKNKQVIFNVSYLFEFWAIACNGRILAVGRDFFL